MRHRSLFPYALLALLLLGVVALPSIRSSLWRGKIGELFAPLWSRIETIKPVVEDHSEVALLRMENAQLKKLIAQEFSLLEQLAALQESSWVVESAEAHRKLLLNAIDQQLAGLPARVIYRSPGSWSSSVWLNVGESSNDARFCVAKNSPVVKEGALIGVVDYVGSTQCRVRLLTDTGLTVAVRAARGHWRDSWLSQQLLLFQRQLAHREDLLSSEERQRFLNDCLRLVHLLGESHQSWLLAKGELCGSSATLWRSPGQLLQGRGFNYDFPDEEGPARDLRTGVPFGQLLSKGAEPLLKVRDLLITTGYDGIFPPGLPVAEVVRILPLVEGDYYYSLEAKPCAGDLLDLDSVTVLPPNGFDSDDQHFSGW